MNVILSIKPKYVHEIVHSRKRYEFRKSIFSNPSVKKVIIYSSYPEKRIIGAFDIGTIISDHPEKLWEQTKDHAGISETEFFSYFCERKIGYAIEILNLSLLDSPINPFESMEKFSPPQSFCYTGNDFDTSIPC